MKWDLIAERLNIQDLRVFSSLEFKRAIGVSQQSAKFLLIRYIKKGLIKRLKARRGLYTLSSFQPHPWLVANKLIRPSYVSFETALSYYGLIPESVYAVTSVTTKTTRSFTALNTLFTYQKIKREAFGGYRPILVDGVSVFLAEPEKALADYLYLVYLGRKELSERIRLRKIGVNKLLIATKVFDKPDFTIWVKKWYRKI